MRFPFVVALAAGLAAMDAASAQEPGRDAEGCGWYVVLGCMKEEAPAARWLAELGGSVVGGGAGTYVVDTAKMKGFRAGFFCVMDGPYRSRGGAESVAWSEVVPDAYVKRGC